MRFNSSPSVLLLCFLSTISFGQGTSIADSLYHSAETFFDQEDYVAAQKDCQSAILQFEKKEDLPKWLVAKRLEADLANEVYKSPFPAIDLLNQALSKMPRQPNSELDYFYLCKLLHGKSWYEKKAENFVALKQDLEWAYQIFKTKLGGQNPDIAEYLLLQLGNCYVRLGEYEGAQRMFEEGIAIGAKSPEVAKFNDFGSLYMTLEKYEEALKIVRNGMEFKGLPTIEIPLLWLNESECLANLGHFEQALVSNGKAAVLLEKMDKKSSRYKRYKLGLYENYAIINKGLAKNGNKAGLNKALIWYDKTLDLAIYQPPKSSNRDIAGFQIEKADLLFQMGDSRKALSFYHQAIQSILPNFTGGLNELPPISVLFAEKMLILALQGKAQVFLALRQPEKALECYELIPFVEAKLRATHAYESSSLLALKESRQRFQEAVDLAWQLFESSNGNPQYAERAFRLTELSRGMLLLQSLIQARQYLPSDIREKDFDLSVHMAWLEQEIASENQKGKSGNGERIKDLERQLFDLKLERQKLLENFPSYNDPDSVFLEVLAAKEVHNLLRPDQFMVNYFLTETAAYIFSFDATGGFQWRKVVLPPDFRAQTQAFISFLWGDEKVNKELFLQQARCLDSLLLEPERKGIGSSHKRLVIIPDDALVLVPFEALLSKSVKINQTWREMPWLLIDYSIGYAYSATLLNLQQGITAEHRRSLAKPPTVFGGFAPSYAQSGAYKLNNTQPMTQRVRNCLGGDACLNGSSTEEKFKNTAKNYQTLLLAMHGIADAEHPELSRLLFGDPGPDSLINNNVLYASELQIMRLQADLVVLSACHSGFGKLEQGEGVFSLARAFAAAGVPATVMSLWLLQENAAPPLVESFFKYLKEGKTKDEALQLAKINFLKNDAYFEMSHPFFWAGLTASGDMSALEFPRKPMLPWSWYWLLLALLIALAAFLGWRHRRKSSIQP